MNAYFFLCRMLHQVQINRGNDVEILFEDKWHTEKVYRDKLVLNHEWADHPLRPGG